MKVQNDNEDINNLNDKLSEVVKENIEEKNQLDDLEFEKQLL